MEAFETEAEYTHRRRSSDLDTEDFEEYENALKEEDIHKPKKRFRFKCNTSSLRQVLLFNSIVPLCIAFVAVVTANSYISNELMKHQGNLIEERVDKTSTLFLKNIGKSMTENIMEPLTLQLRMIQKLKEMILNGRGRNGFRFLEEDTGRYDRYFKKNVDNKKIRIECFSILELISNSSQGTRMQKCLILNDLYSTLKFHQWDGMSNVKEQIPLYPSIVIGLESGRALNLFHNMTKDEEISQIKSMHPDLIYDLAIVETLSPYVIDERNIIYPENYPRIPEFSSEVRRLLRILFDTFLQEQHQPDKTKRQNGLRYYKDPRLQRIRLPEQHCRRIRP